MDAIPSERSSSVLSLVKRLAGERWICVYETLLDISGEYRCARLPHTPQNRLVDIISELYILGNTSDASLLKQLTDSFSPNGEHADALVVLLLCANITSESCQNLPRFPVGETIYPSYASSANFQARAFLYDDIAESALQKRDLFTPFSIDEKSSESRDCIAETSRCEHESYNFWLRHNLTGGDNADTSTFPNRSNVDASATLGNSKKPNIESRACKEDVVLDGRQLVKESLDATHQDREICNGRLHSLFHMCIAGPSLDEQADSDARSLPTFLFQSSKIAEAKPSPQKSRVFARRRRVVKALKSWAHQLRCIPDPRNIPPSRTRALMCGLVYNSVISFGPVYLSEESSTALKAVVSYVELRADSYVGMILKLTDPACANCTIQELLILDTAESFAGELREIGGLLECIEETDGSSESILNTVSNRLRLSPCSTSLQGLFLHVTSEYEKVLQDWVMEGSCVPAERIALAESTKWNTDVTNVALNLTGRPSEPQVKSSPCEQSSLFSENQALFFRRAGHGRAILRQLKLDNMCTRATALQWGCPTEEGKQQQHRPGLLARTPHDQPVLCGFSGEGDMLVFTKPLRKYSSGIGSASNNLESHSISCFAFPEEPSVDGHSNKSQSSDEKELSVVKARSESRRFSSAVHPTLYAELTVSRFHQIDEEVQRRIFESFVNDLEIFAHLDFIRKYILLGAGDFANALVEQINSASLASESSEVFLRNREKAALTFYGSADAGKRQVRSLLHLERCFRTAMYLFNTGTERFASHVKLELSASLDDKQSSDELWDHHIKFVYEVSDPLKFIISAEAMSMYSMIHAFFLRVHRAKMSLRNLFMITRRHSVLSRMPSLSLMSNNKLLSMLWLFCMDSEQFVNTLGGFFMDQVIGSAWESFKCLWKSCQSVWALQDAHRRFLEGSMQRCLLDPRQKNLRNVICGGFDIIHNVEKELTKLHESSTVMQVDITTLLDLISSASASLRRRAVFLSDVLERLFEAGTWHATSVMAWC